MIHCEACAASEAATKKDVNVMSIKVMPYLHDSSY
jgi:hypothetical protein